MMYSGRRDTMGTCTCQLQEAYLSQVNYLMGQQMLGIYMIRCFLCFTACVFLMSDFIPSFTQQLFIKYLLYANPKAKKINK